MDKAKIQQLTDDGGKAADRLNGFVGRAFGVGPILTYLTKLGKSHFDLPEGDRFMLSATFKF
jgi:hypothetical protein